MQGTPCGWAGVPIEYRFKCMHGHLDMQNSCHRRPAYARRYPKFFSDSCELRVRIQTRCNPLATLGAVLGLLPVHAVTVCAVRGAIYELPIGGIGVRGRFAVGPPLSPSPSCGRRNKAI